MHLLERFINGHLPILGSSQHLHFSFQGCLHRKLTRWLYSAAFLIKDSEICLCWSHHIQIKTQKHFANRDNDSSSTPQVACPPKQDCAEGCCAMGSVPITLFATIFLSKFKSHYHPPYTSHPTLRLLPCRSRLMLIVEP